MSHRTEADTCRELILPKLYAAGWDDDHISEQRTFTDGRIAVTECRGPRRTRQRAEHRTDQRGPGAPELIPVRGASGGCSK